MFKHPLTRSLMLAAALGSGTAQAASLELTIEGIKAAEGHLLIAVYDRAEVWLRGAPLTGARAKAEAGSVTVTLADLPEGAVVAISALQDLNGNGRMDKNAMGMPVEPYGFSRDAAGSFGPPNFEAAKITVTGVTKAKLTLN
ncbi:uncharacterized protein (DUF2141 family) [Inhella inkyongensis]|uniref:Uncharacterized protein (DUF2141 family) n=1 Tax=Inhella inkyongensis TaxID=392593 RepID=A0A840S748_9BURK|nr:DUF2141 domain-containing protein [Inhella inkyongensis]MBB5205503.1 uncharacterized protein (DUF2141 family) [Inhella inkyongensis]